MENTDFKGDKSLAAWTGKEAAAMEKTKTEAKKSGSGKSVSGKKAGLEELGGKIGKTAGAAAARVEKTVDTAEKSVSDGLRGVKDLVRDADSGKAGAGTRNEMFQKICALIPNKVNNETVVSAFEILRRQQKLLKKDFTAHRKKNEESFAKHLAVLEKNKGYVEDQNSYTDMAYGDSTMQYSGCEVFATFNALRNIAGKTVMSLSKMISEYEKDGMVLSGKFGTSPKAIRDFLEKNGYRTEFCMDETLFDEVGKRSDSLILTMYNDRDDISKQVHTINISKEDGRFTAHNAYCNGKVVGPYPTVKELLANLNQGRVRGISLIGIRK